MALRRVRFARVRVPSDGDCFFHTLAICLKHADKPTRDARTLRTALARYQAAQLRRARSAHHRAQLVRSVQRLRGNEWAEHDEVAAAAHLHGLHIRVFEGANRMWISFGNTSHPTVYVLNARNDHFEPLVRR